METRKKRSRVIDNEADSNSDGSDIEWSLESKRQDASKPSSSSSSAKKKEKMNMENANNKGEDEEQQGLIAPSLKRSKRQLESHCFFNLGKLKSLMRDVPGTGRVYSKGLVAMGHAVELFIHDLISESIKNNSTNELNLAMYPQQSDVTNAIKKVNKFDFLLPLVSLSNLAVEKEINIKVKGKKPLKGQRTDESQDADESKQPKIDLSKGIELPSLNFMGGSGIGTSISFDD